MNNVLVIRLKLNQIETRQQKIFPANKFNAILHVDIIGPLELTELCNSYAVTMIDKFSRYPMVIPVPNILAETVAKAVLKWISYFGPPNKIVSDNGKQFIGLVFKSLCDLLSIKHGTTSVYHPQSNGAIERFHRWLKERLRLLHMKNIEINILERINWDEYIDLLMYVYRRTPSTPTGVAPASIVLGYTPLSPSQWNMSQEFTKALKDNKYQSWNSYVRNMRDIFQAQAQSKQEKYDKMRTSKNITDEAMAQAAFEINDIVYYDITSTFTTKKSKFIKPRHIGPYKVVAVSQSKLNYNLIDLRDLEADVLVGVHYDKLKKHKSNKKISKEERDEKIRQNIDKIEQKIFLILKKMFIGYN